MPKKSNSCKTDKDCDGGKTCCGGGCYGPDAENRPKCYQEADFEFGKEEEYEEVVTRAPRATRGCNIWTEGMQVYNKEKILFGDVISSTWKNVTVKLYENGKITKKEEVWDCKDVSQTDFTKTVNAKRNLKKIKRSITILRIPGRGRLQTQDGMKNQQQDTIYGSIKGQPQNEEGRKARDERESKERRERNTNRNNRIGNYKHNSSRYQDLKF